MEEDKLSNPDEEEIPRKEFIEEEEVKEYNDQCQLLKMITLPLVGLYGNDYHFLELLLALKKQEKPKYLPQLLLDQITNLKEKYPEVEPEYFQLSFSTDGLDYIDDDDKIPKLSEGFIRLNIISHPYIFYNCELNKEHKTYIHIAAYTNDDELDTIQKANWDNDLDINSSDNILSDKFKKELILHLSNDRFPSLSPNNCGIMVNLNSQINNFYVMVLGTYQNKVVKCFIGNYILISNGKKSSLFTNLSNALSDKISKENIIKAIFDFHYKFTDSFKYILYYCINEIENAKDNELIKDILFKAFKIIFDFVSGNVAKEVHEENLSAMANYYYENIFHFIKEKLFTSKFNLNIKENDLFLFKNKNPKYLGEFIAKYVKYQLKRTDNIIATYLDYIDYTNDEKLFTLESRQKENHTENVWPDLKNYYCSEFGLEEDKFEEIKEEFDKRESECENPNIKELNELIKKIDKEENVYEEHLKGLDDYVRNRIFYNTWVSKGSPMGIHDDFGKASFLHWNNLGKEYHCSTDEMIKICQDLIEELKKIDEKYEK